MCCLVSAIVFVFVLLCVIEDLFPEADASWSGPATQGTILAGRSAAVAASPQQFQKPAVKLSPGSSDGVTHVEPEPQQQKQQQQQQQQQLEQQKQSVAPVAPVWIFCASQWQECLCYGTVRWGTRDTWAEYKAKRDGAANRVVCSISKLPDVAPGDDTKHCECAVQPGSDFHHSLNPALLEGAMARKSKLAASCEIFEAARKDSESAASLWEAVAAFCSDDWATLNADARTGNRAMSLDTMRSLMRAWVDDRFVGNYKRFFKEKGWAERGFVNYYAGAPGGKHVRMTEELINSVHAFSSEPIIVFHFGTFTPKTWSAEKWPQLVLFHAAPIPPHAHRSFNFNKLRAMLLCRVRVGMQLDSDQFVAPGVDAIFGRTAQEITKDYAMPILPVHFLDRTPQDTGAYWARYCPGDVCRWQTTRWGHAHPTWTFWALPWIGRWLRRNFRDEWLPEKKGGEMSALRVTDIPEDEDLLNVGTWEEGGTKQWCKIDLPGPDDFNALLHTDPGAKRCTWSCGNVSPDRRFHPQGAAKVFYTAHHAVDPMATIRWVAQLKSRKNSLPPPIMYRGRFYKTGQEMMAEHPNVKCII
eukprot:CAMPEP_0172791856 /NCGR_PEP_ID=MMETSP1074-20121228/208679_1 /TAXON_ID=2916 /ORGANISM="Ceratium fusus, Strain PA161109" /LENGTH=583 /DNA_ID=CAMNT_0013628919 /DNA_START=62 /DNA_END=1813 /DNA_ORIENTATION=+